MRTRILALLAGTTLAAAMVAAAPPASASATWSDARSDATVSDLPFTGPVDLSTMAPDASDPTDCETTPNLASAWSTFTLTGPTALDIESSTTLWSWAPVFAVYPHGSDSSVACVKFQSMAPPTVHLTAGTYDVMVATIDPGVMSIDITLEVIPPPADDDWSDATALGSLPANPNYDIRSASLQPGEPLAPCREHAPTGSEWYSFTAPAYGWIDVQDYWSMTNTFALYTATGGGAPVYAGQCVNNWGTMRVTPGTQYLLQVSGYSPVAGSFGLLPASPPDIRIQPTPQDPSTYDTVGLTMWLANGVADLCTISFGDGARTESTTDCLMGTMFSHRYAKDGTYTVTASVVARDGRTGSTSTQLVIVTHDVAVTSLSAPKTANVGKAKQIGLSVATLTKRSEYVRVTLSAGRPDGSWTTVGSTTLTLSGKKSVPLTFTWISAASDIGSSVVLRASVYPIDPTGFLPPRDAQPSNNELSSSPIRVNR